MGTCACVYRYREPGSDTDSENYEGDLYLENARTARAIIDSILNEPVSIATSIDSDLGDGFVGDINLTIGSYSESSGAENVDDISYISFEEEINPKTKVHIDDDTCSICVSKFDDWEHSPEILPCGHTLCSVCVRKMAKRHKFLHVKCPLDRKVHKLKSRKLDDGLRMSNLHIHDNTIGLNDARGVYGMSVVAEYGSERSNSLDNNIFVEDVPNERGGPASVNVNPPDSAIHAAGYSNNSYNVRNISPGRTGDSTAHARRLPRLERQSSPVPRIEFTESDIEADFGRHMQRGRRRHLPVTGDLGNVGQRCVAISDVDASLRNKNETNLYSGEALIHRGYHPIPTRNSVTAWHVYDGHNRHKVN